MSNREAFTVDKEYYISSTKYSLQERQTKKGRVYDVVFRIIEKKTLSEKQKWLRGFKTKTEAREAYADFITTRCDLVKDKPKPIDGSKTNGVNSSLIISDLARLYFASLSNQLKDATIYEKQKIFDLIILPRFGEMDIRFITTQELYKWQDELWAKKNPRTGKPYAYKYLSKIRTYFSAFLSWCAVRYPEVKNNLLAVQKPKRRTPQAKMQFWTRDEFEKFIQYVKSPTCHALFATLFFTGRRKGEVLALSPEDIDLRKGTINFNKSITRKTLDDSAYNITSTKTELVASTPICKTLLNELKNYEGGSPFYFGGKTPITDNTLRRYFNKACEKACVKQIRIHDLRHSFVSMCIHLGATIPVVADLIGDTIAQVTKTYAHMYEDDKRKIIEEIG